MAFQSGKGAETVGDKVSGSLGEKSQDGDGKVAEENAKQEEAAEEVASESAVEEPVKVKELTEKKAEEIGTEFGDSPAKVAEEIQEKAGLKT